MRKPVLPDAECQGPVSCSCASDQPLFEALLDTSLDIICSVDRNGRFTYVSAAARRVWGYEPEELVGRAYMELVVPSDHKLTTAVAASLTSGTEVTGFENNYIRKDGSLVPILWSARWSEAEKTLYCVGRDNSEKKQAGQTDQLRLAAIYDAIQDGFFSVDRNFTILHFNRKSEQILLKRKADIIGKCLWDEYHEAIALKFYTETNRAFRENTSVHFEEYLPSLGKWFEVSAYPSAEGLSVYFQDINPRKQLQQKLQLANNRFELATKATSDVIWDWEIESGNCFFNEQFTLLYGYENKEDSVFKNWMDNIHIDDKASVVASVNSALKNAGVRQWEREYRFCRKDGSTAHVLDRGFIIRDAHGEAVRMVGSMQDITRLKQEATELKKLSLVAEKTVNAVVMTDSGQRITWVNQAFTDITGYSLEEALGKRPDKLLHGPRTSPKTKAYLRDQIRKGLPFQCDILKYSKSGKEFWVEVKGQPILNERGEVEQFFAIQTDITERIELQQLVVEEKIEAQREITKAMIQAQEKERSEIGKELHDNVNQILTTIKLYLENIRHFPGQRDLFIDKGLALTQKAMEESRSLAHRLVAPALGDGSFRLTIEELLGHYQLLNLFTVDFAFTVCEEKLGTSFRLAIYRIIQECLTNVVKHAKATRVTVSILYEDQLVKLIISDNGLGFDASAKSGGIGFVNMRNRASLFKGEVQVNATPETGCTINVFFPTINGQVIPMGREA
ncbi:PAS domain S-box protein [Flaviaesturariibacter flavus]|uniref:histidine kinase n=1 Tax=Flaviaesturariibacter flavus TaxID=2502780 RepID=A0A4R1BC91_9BACT|nr:PAS domain-containing sensor histidine kinase [Flaviaesturariibacter flavus]TCJ14597.1 PAS domain S-box protein [Flaviaesturariibacter flavus]